MSTNVQQSVSSKMRNTNHDDTVKLINNHIEEFKTIASGTISVLTGTQFPNTGGIDRPSKFYKNYVLLLQNKTGIAVSTIACGTEGVSLPNTPANTFIDLGNPPKNVTSIANNGFGSIEMTNETPNPFAGGKGRFTFNLASATTADGTIDWVLIGY